MSRLLLFFPLEYTMAGPDYDCVSIPDIFLVDRAILKKSKIKNLPNKRKDVVLSSELLTSVRWGFGLKPH